jgi:hypothetical protein
MTGSVRDVASEADLLAALGPAQPDGRALILLGGADSTEPERLAELRILFERIARLCARSGTAVVDGGTDSGVMRLMGEGRDSIGGTFPLIGVVPAGAFGRRTRIGAVIEPARHHSLVLGVPGNRFGDETPWLFRAADHLGGGSAATIVVNGGRLALVEAHRRLAAGHPVIAVEGSGRAADDLVGDEVLRTSRRLRVIPVSADEAALASAIDGGREGARDQP